MNTGRLVNTLLEDDYVDPKEMAVSIPSDLDTAKNEAMEEFMRQIDQGMIANAREADEKASEIAQEMCADNFLENNDDYEAVVTPLFAEAAKWFPGKW